MQGGPCLRPVWSTGGNDSYPGNAFVTQTKDIKTSKVKSYKANATQIEVTTGQCLVADDFRQEEFVSPYTQVRPYLIIYIYRKTIIRQKNIR